MQRVARQLGYGVETVRKWVNQADVDAGARPRVTTEDNAKIRRLGYVDKSNDQRKRLRSLMHIRIRRLGVRIPPSAHCRARQGIRREPAMFTFPSRAARWWGRSSGDQ